MNSIFFISSKNKNIYLIDIQSRNICLVHPSVPYIYYANPLVNKLFDVTDIDHYKAKLSYYRKHKIIEITPMPENEQLSLSKEVLEDNVANIRQVLFETTEQCNLKCKYCFYGELYDAKNAQRVKKLSPKYAENITGYILDKQNSSYNKSINNEMYVSFYGGEPLLNSTLISGIISRYRDGQRHLRKIEYSITTNATLLDKHIDLLVNNNIRLTISLDGNKANNSYRVYRNNKNSFDKIVSNLKRLRSLHPQYFATNVTFNAVLHNRNSVEEINQFYKDNFDRLPNIIELNNSYLNKEKEDDFHNMYEGKQQSATQSENFEKIESEMFISLPAYMSTVRFLHQYFRFVYKSYEHLLGGEKVKSKISTGTCLPFSRKIFITAHGKILPCEKISHEYTLGQINENGVDLDLTQIAAKYNRYYKNLKTQCLQCYQQLSCTQCIFFIDELDHNPVCKGFMTEIQFVNYLTENISFMEEHSSRYKQMMHEVTIR